MEFPYLSIRIDTDPYKINYNRSVSAFKAQTLCKRLTETHPSIVGLLHMAAALDFLEVIRSREGYAMRNSNSLAFYDGLQTTLRWHRDSR